MKTNLFSKFIVVLTALVAMGMSGVSYAANVTLTMNLNASPAAGGSVSLDGDSYKASATDVHAEKASLSWTGYPTISHVFSLYANANEDYVFKGFATSESANSGNTSNPYMVTLSKSGSITDQSETQTYYAIFAKMKAESEDELAFGQVLKTHSKTLSVVVNHVHAGTVTASLEGNEEGLFAITAGASASSNQNDVNTTISVSYNPVESETEASATLVISSNNGLSTISIPLSGSCPPQLTPEFTLPKTEIELEETVAFTFSEFTDPQVVVADESIVSYDAINHTLTGLALGSTTVTLTQEETGEVLPAEKVFTIVVTKINPLLAITEGGYAKTLISILPNGQTTIGFSTRSNAELSFVQLSGESYVSYNSDTQVLSAIGKGVAEFVASQPENDRYFAAETRVSVWVKSKYHVPVTVDQSLYNDGNFKTDANGDNSWRGNDGICIGGYDGWLEGTTNWDDKYVEFHFEGIPDKLSFDFKYIYRDDIANQMTATAPLSNPVPGEKYFLYVEESADRVTWTPISWQHTQPNKSAWLTSGDQQLKKTTRYLRFHLHANYGALYRNIHISELKYVEDPVPASIDMGTAVINSGEVKANPYINWCNIAPMSVVSSNNRFTVTPASFGNYDEFGTQVLEISYTHGNVAGAQEADITISNTEAAYTKTIHVTANTTKRTQTIVWNADLAATGFAMNTGEQFPDALIPAVATATNGERVTFTSDNPEVIEVIADTALLAKAVGTVNITAYQAGDNEYDEVSDTKSFVVTELLKQTITWEQSFLGLLTTSEPVALTATATSGGEIVYSSADESVVAIVDGVLTVVGEGETYITASQAGGEIDGHEYLPVEMRNYVIVRNPASECKGVALAHGSLTLGAQLKRETYDLSGIPETLTFSAYHGEKSAVWGTGVSYAELVVDQYACINGLWDWYTVFSQVVGTSAASYSAPIDETATKIRFSTGETAVNHNISDIRVTRAKFLRADLAEINDNAEFNTTWTKKVTVSHSNIDLMTLSTTQGLFTLNQATLGEGCDDFSDDEFIVSFTPHEKNVDFYDTIVITDNKENPSTLLIPVHIFTTGLNQIINGFELPDEALTTDEIPPFQATATSELEVIYLSSDSTVAYVENNQLIILSAGTVSITAYQAGDNRYNEASVTKTIVLSLTPVEITTVPTASWISLGEPLSASILADGVASVPGVFAWINADSIPEIAGEQLFTLRFTPLQQTIYESVEMDVTVDVREEQHTQAILWDQEITDRYVNTTYPLSAAATSGLDVYYVSSDSTIAYVENNELIVLGVTGNVTITAHQDGNPFYQAAEPVAKVINVIPRPTSYGDYEAAFCEGDSIEFAGVWYYEATTTDVLLEEKNFMDGDSIVHLTISTYPVYRSVEEKELHVGMHDVWENIELANLVEGDSTILASYSSIHGCDSIIELHLHVLPMIITYGRDTLVVCAGETVLYNDKEYKHSTEEDVTLPGANIYGGDSIVTLVVEVLPVMRVKSSQTITEGDEAEWQGIDLSLLPAGDTTLTVIYTSVNGCDSTFILNLEVIGAEPGPTGINTIQESRPAEKFFLNGQLYIRKDERLYTPQGALIETKKED